jgi:hypothetical protein
LEHALGCRDLVHGGEIDVAELFDVDRSAILFGLVMYMEESGGRAYNIGFVVVLRVVFEDFCLLRVVEVAYQIIELEVFAPFLAVLEPTFLLGYDCMTGGMPTYMVSARVTSNLRARRNRSYKQHRKRGPLEKGI